MKKFVGVFLTISAFAVSIVAFPAISLIAESEAFLSFARLFGVDSSAIISQNDETRRKKRADGSLASSPTAAFTPGNIVIYRVGSGAAALNGNATAVFLDEYSPTGSLVQSIPMPTAVVLSNRRLTASGTATSEGLMTRSTDGRYLLVPGYDAATGTGSIVSSASATINRVVGRVDASGAVDTSTALTDALSGDNPRGAASTNGTDIWLSGSNSAGGVRHTTFGATTSTSLTAAPTNFRGIAIYGGQLYGSHQATGFRMSSIGTGIPTTTDQTTTALPGFPTSTTLPNQFVFADLDATVSGVDTLYIADESNLAGGGGARKYSLVAGNWTFNGVIGLTVTRGLTATVTGSNVTLYATNQNAPSQTTLQTATDTAGYNAAPNGAFTSLATAGTNTAFRGIALAPVAADTTPPTVTSMDDGDADDAVIVGGTLTYTVTFSEDIDASGIAAGDFDNSGTAGISIGTINETSPGMFTVQVTADSAGTLVLRIPTGAVIEDVAGNDLLVPVSDDTSLTVTPIPTPTPTPSPTPTPTVSPVKAMWVFGGSTIPNPVSDGAGRATLLSRSAASGVDRLFVSVYQSSPNGNGRRMYDEDAIGELISGAHTNNQEVWAAYGASDWPTFGCTAGDFPVQRMAEIAAYNASRPTEEQFDGVMLDVEPHPTSEAQFQALIAHYQCMRDSLPSSVKLGVAISAFWDDDPVTYPVAGGTVKMASEHIIDLNLDSVVVMGYRDTAGTDTCPSSDGIICLDKAEIDYATSVNKPGLILAGLETIDPATEGLLDKETFYEEGLTALEAESANVSGYFSSSNGFGGFAIHNYTKSYLIGTAAWPSGNLLVVNTNLDENDGSCGDGDCSLRDAIALSVSGDTIVFDTAAFPLGGAAQEIILGGTEMVIDDDVTITGPGADVLTIGYPVSPGTQSRIFSIADSTVTISGVTLRRGNAQGATQSGDGGAIFASGSALTLNGVHLNLNTAPSGGAAYLQLGTHQFLNSTCSSNSGGNAGGCIFAIGATLTVSNSTIDGNSANSGGGIAGGNSELTISNATITDNTSLTAGGGISLNGGSLILASSIVAGNSATTNGPEIVRFAGTFTSNGFNLVGDEAGDAENTLNPITYALTDILNTPPSLDLLANNGGPTPTRMPLAGSPVIDQGNAFGLALDQRGITRVIDLSTPNASGGDGTDIGAVEIPVPTAAPAFISGRVISANGVGLRNVIVTVEGGDLEGARSVATGTFGYYRIEGLTSGQSYVVSVRSRRYVFADGTRLVNLIDNVSDLDFAAQP